MAERIFTAEDDFTCYEAQGLATEPWLVAEGEFSDATPSNIVDEMMSNLKPGRYHIKLIAEVTAL